MLIDESLDRKTVGVDCRMVVTMSCGNAFAVVVLWWLSSAEGKQTRMRSHTHECRCDGCLGTMVANQMQVTSSLSVVGFGECSINYVSPGVPRHAL